MEKLKALWAVFRKGEAVANPSAWKAGQVTVTMLAGLLIAAVQLAKAFGYDIPIDNDAATAIAGGLLAAVNVVLTISTSKHVGLPAVKESTNDNITDDVRARAKAYAQQNNTLSNNA